MMLNKKRISSKVIALVITALMLISLAIPVWAATGRQQKIERFERYNPVHTETVNPGTVKENLNLPDTLRAVVSLNESVVSDSAFVQAKPKVDLSDGYEHYDYYYYGYVAPKNVSDIYASGKKAIYSLLYAAQDGSGNDANAPGEVAYRIYGSLGGSENTWFACNEAGVINGVVVDIPVAWEDDGYDKDTLGEYTFTASFSGYTYTDEQPFATIFVQDIPEDGDLSGEHDYENDECNCSYGENVSSEEHEKDCPYYLKKNDECTCEAPDGEAHREDCPMYVRKAEDCHCGPTGEEIDEDNFPWAHREDCTHFSPVECMCRETTEIIVENITDDIRVGENIVSLVPGDLSHIHDGENTDCPLYGKGTVRIIKLATGEESVMAKDNAEYIVAMQEQGRAQRPSGGNAQLPYPALGRIEIIDGSEQAGSAYDTGMVLLSVNGGGLNDVAQDNFMLAKTKTSGNTSYSSQYTGGITIPGVWIDYVNTIWMNKAFNKFAWTPATDTGAHKDWEYTGHSAGQTINDVTTNPFRIPTKTGTTWTVYSGEQFRYALINMVSGDTVSLAANLNMNGNEVTWNTYNEGRKNMTIAGNNFKIYNLGLLQTSATDNTLISSLIYNYLNLNVSNLEFVTAKFVTSQGYAGMFRGPADAGPFNQTVTITNMHITDSMFYSSHSNSTIAPFGMLASHNNSTTINSRTVLNNCSTSGGYIYGKDHVSSFVLGVGNYHSSSPSNFDPSAIKNCFSVDNLLCGTGAHSAGFTSCAGGRVIVDDCFTANEIYGSAMTSGFVGFPSGTYNNCYSTGKLEGYMRLAGFGWDSGATASGFHWSKYYNNCYSTTLVGLRTKGSSQGGFAMMEGVDSGGFKITMKDCYSAGEVGNYDIDMNNPKNIGGYMSHSSELNRYVMKNCYYDKQTSAMREWVAGDIKTAAGVTGVLTTTTTKGGTGLASGTYGATGFTGFSNNAAWVYEAEHYPQLYVFANAEATKWGTTARADLVRAYSLASTSTVMLDTWDTGYDWSDTGVRTVGETSYDRTLVSTGKTSHKGYQYTYDTVREIISPFTVTSNAGYSHMVSGGAPSEQDIEDGTITSLTNTVTIDNTVKTGFTENPGMDWYKISASINGQTGHRPIRLIGYMNLEAGKNQTVSCGQKYDHRPDVELTMMDRLTDNLVVGMDDSKIWSASMKGTYPDSRKYYALRTTNMETDFSASEDAWIYTEIWRAAQNIDGTYVQDTTDQYGYIEGSNKLVPDISVKVTGEGTGNGTTLSEQKWNGDVPINPDSSIEQKYIVIYYWMLTDGRYVTDYKVITLEPSEYDLIIDVHTLINGDKSDPLNSSSLYLGTGPDDTAGDLAYVLSTDTETHHETLDIGYSKNAAAAWKKIHKGVTILKTQIDLYANDADRTPMGTATVNGSLTKGSTITIPTTYYYNAYEYDPIQDQNREVMNVEVLDIVYTVAEKEADGIGTGEYYLRFNKLANAPSDETAAALLGTNDTSGIPSSAIAYINDLQFNTEITLWVKGGMDFEFIKVDEAGNPFDTGEAEFQLYSCSHSHDTACGGLLDPGKCNHYHKVDSGGTVIPGDNHAELASDISEAGGCWAVNDSTVLTAITDVDGKIVFDNLYSGDYMLAETSTLPGYQLPVGQWLIQVDTVAGTIKITARGETPPAFMQDGSAVLKLPNYPTITFPPTGGNGTILFTLIGIAFIGIAGMLVVVAKRKKGGESKLNMETSE